jgi:hypothetical protein
MAGWFVTGGLRRLEPAQLQFGLDMVHFPQCVD